MANKTITPEQEARQQEYIDWGVKVGFCTDPIDESAVEPYAKRLMDFMSRDYKAAVIADDPITACYMVTALAVVELSFEMKDAEYIWKKVFDLAFNNGTDDNGGLTPKPTIQKVADRHNAYLTEKVGKHLPELYKEVLGDIVKRYKGPKQRDSKKLRKTICDMLWFKALEQALLDPIFVWPHLDGQFYSYYVAWHHYHRDVLNVQLDDIWFIEDQIQFGGVSPLNNFVVVTRRLETLKLNEQERPHCDGGPSIAYPGGILTMYHLNGVQVPEWLAMTPDTQIDPMEFTKITNVEVRREFVRKVGIERIVQKIGGKLMDKKGNYELLAVDLGGHTGKVPYLKMLNPSLADTWHMEAVPPTIKTVKEALAWRNQTDLEPRQLT